MKIKLLVATIILCTLSQLAFSQGHVKGTIKGVNSNKKEEPLAFANVYWIGTSVGAAADANGAFSINHPKGATKLVARTIGFKSDTLTISPGTAEVEFVLVAENVKLDEIVVSGRQRGSTLLALTPLKTEVITASGICKMACCNLAESFENTASVSVGFSDAVSGARQIRMLGLAGTYTQMLDENRAVMRGIAAPYGLTYTPGQWLESIQVSKGPGSVVNGYEAITGQINAEHRKPTTKEPLFINLFADSDQRTEANVASSLQLNERLSTVTLVHASTDPMKKDHNKDGFMDMPTAKQINFANRWLYMAPSEAQIRAGVKVLAEERNGGQMSDASVANNYGLGLYKSKINNKQFNTYLKFGMPVGEHHDHAEHAHEAEEKEQHEGELHKDDADKDHQHEGEAEEECHEVEKSIALVADYTYHEQDSYFGIKNYNADMHSAFANLLFQGGFNESNRYELGASFRFDRYNEMLIDRFMQNNTTKVENHINLDRTERTAGVFGEYTFSKDEKMTFILGARGDHNSLYGWLFTPRANFKWDITDKLTFRASGGRGYRSPNPISDNMGILATGRQIAIDNNLKMEDAWTYGASIVKYFKLFNDERASLSLDAFRTQFNNQLIVDQEYNTALVSIYNLDGQSYTNSFQVDLNVAPVKRFTIFATYRYTDAKVDLKNQGLVKKPMVDKFKALVNLQYATKMNKWTFDFTAQLNGQTLLPNLSGDLTQKKEYSEVYPMFFGQVTHKFKKVDVYVGCENIGNYRQKNPILSADAPFSTAFNSSIVWGPLMGRKAYAGLRFTL
jgi:outer membrane receptor for ferrienterochelin and colicin